MTMEVKVKTTPTKKTPTIQAPRRRPLRPPGMVGVIAQDTARFSAFAGSLTSLEVPEETAIKWIIGHSIASSTNMLVRAMLESEAEWLWILGDDHTFNGTILHRLLDRDKDIVVPNCLTRFPPYKPVSFTGFAAEDSMYRRRLDLNDHPGGGLVAIHSAGSGGMLVRRHVFECIEDPWFEAAFVSSVEIGEDVRFCDKAREEGFGIYVDLDVSLGHITTAGVWPVKHAGGWTYGFGFAGGKMVTMPPWEDAEDPSTEKEVSNDGRS